MNLVEQLLKADVKKADEFESGVYRSRKLAKLLGKKGTVDVTIREIASRKVNDIVAYQVDKKGNFDFSKSYDAKLLMVIEGVADPDLRSKELQNHFGCDNAKELAEKLFGSEINELSDAISALSGLTSDTTDEEEIKN
jgi:hypothetical protein